ncbi:MAG: aminotransferase class V-fold PLP-dependent enzyme [Proteobacteria bacterium]|nr:aminotransferase class V-fold PLP-dependent enzyme [Pseudomonadota bacterium]MBS0574144.1 aminotransferase class V-fold PLP-dependent enzyme [Pseudomonadota bacterium]
MAGAPDGQGYFLYHSIGQYPGKARDMAEGMARFSEVWGRADDLQWPYALGVRQSYIDRWRAIIGAPEGTVTATESVTAGLGALIGALPDAALRGRRLLVAGDCFPSVHFLLAGLQDSRGFTLDTVPLRPGAHWVEDEDILARWGADVGLALLTWVSSTSSHRSDLGPLIAHGRRMGSLIGADITQGAGLLPFDAMAPAVDFTLSTSLKWMCGSPGAGMLHVAPGLIAEARPTLRGWFSQPDPFNWDFDRFSYAPDIRRFDHGTPGIMAAAASLPALDWHAGQDKAAILAQNRALSDEIGEGIAALGLPFVSPRAEAARGGSVMALLPGDRPAPHVIAGLREKGIAADARGRTLRLSPGVMTTAGGVAHLLRTLHGLLK